MADKRKEPRQLRGTPAARGQNGRAARSAKGALSMKAERSVVEASRQVRSREKAVVKAQAKLRKVIRTTGGAGLRLKDIIAHRPGGLSRKILR